jgi:hypothetical protein
MAADDVLFRRAWFGPDHDASIVVLRSYIFVINRCGTDRFDFL